MQSKFSFIELPENIVIEFRAQLSAAVADEKSLRATHVTLREFRKESDRFWLVQLMYCSDNLKSPQLISYWWLGSEGRLSEAKNNILDIQIKTQKELIDFLLNLLQKSETIVERLS